VRANCGPEFEHCWSEPLTVTTSIWGDIVGHCEQTICTEPDGSAGIVDVTAVLDKWKNLPGNPMKARCDVEPDQPDWLVNITDVIRVNGAFLGDTYPPPGGEDWGPKGCPRPE